MKHVNMVIPFYNEERRMSIFVKKFRQITKEFEGKIHLILVDDYSTDNSRHQLVDLCKKLQFNARVISSRHPKGKGGAIKSGLSSCTLNEMILCDFDLPFSPREMINFIQYPSNFLMGYRSSESTFGSDLPLLRKICHYGFQWIFQRVHSIPAVDPQCPLKKLNHTNKVEVLKSIHANGYDFDSALVIHQFQRDGYVNNFPIVMKNEANSKVNILLDSFPLLLKTLKLKN